MTITFDPDHPAVTVADMLDIVRQGLTELSLPELAAVAERQRHVADGINNYPCVAGVLLAFAGACDAERDRRVIDKAVTDARFVAIAAAERDGPSVADTDGIPPWSSASEQGYDGE